MKNENVKLKKEKVWNFNFLLLWQGSFVSALGDNIYEIALGFWILAMTGSTALMGSLMAASTIPRVLIAPFAGVIIDRSNRKWLLVLMDFMRGVAVVLVAAEVYLGEAKVWMVFAAGIIIGLGAAFFDPAISSVIPDIVSRDNLLKGNSFFSMIRAGSGILGNSLGGILYTILGAPLMFLINGLSYLFSAGTETFLKIPNIHKTKEHPHFFQDMKSGMKYVWKNRGIRFLFLTAGTINFFAFIGIVLLIPLFKRTDFLGPARYGITMALFTLGMILGMAVTAAVKIPSKRRLTVFALSTVLMVVFFGIFPLWHSFWIMLLCIALGGFFNAIVNVLISSILQLTVPQDMRGKVFGLLTSISGGLTPLGMAIGGLLGEVLPIPYVISGSFVAIGITIFPFLGTKGIKDFFNTDEEVEEGQVE